MSFNNASGSASSRINSTLHFSRQSHLDTLGKVEPAPWKRAVVEDLKKQTVDAGPDKQLPPWVAGAGQWVAGASRQYLPSLYNLGIHIGQNIRSYMDGNNNIRADIAEFLKHPAVLAAAASVAPRIIGALAINQLAFGALPQIGPQPPL